MEQAAARVWKRLEEELKEHDTSLRSLYGDGWSAEPLSQRAFQVLTAVSMLRGEGDFINIADTVGNWVKGFNLGRCATELDRLTRRGLARSLGSVWEVTEDGERALARARAEGRDVADVRQTIRVRCMDKMA